MFCPNCGSQAPDGVKFCPKCGKAFENAGGGNDKPIGNVESIDQTADPASMAGQQSAGKGKKLGKRGKIILASVAALIGVVILIAGIVWLTLPIEKKLQYKIKVADSFKKTSLDLSGYDTSSVTDMSHMFNNCGNLTELDLSSFDTSSVTDMNCMFFMCDDLKKLDLSSFDTSSVTDMSSMFSDCGDLKELDLSNFDTSSVTDMNCMFFMCDDLKKLDLSSFDTSSVTEDMGNIFLGCVNLKTVYLGDGWTDEWIKYVKDNYPDINFVMK